MKYPNAELKVVINGKWKEQTDAGDWVYQKGEEFIFKQNIQLVFQSAEDLEINRLMLSRETMKTLIP